MNEDQNFMSYPVVKRREILMNMAKKELAEMAPSGRVLSMVTDTSDNGGQASRGKMAKWDNVYRYIRERKDYKLHYKIDYEDRRRPQRIYGSDIIFARYRRWIFKTRRQW